MKLFLAILTLALVLATDPAAALDARADGHRQSEQNHTTSTWRSTLSDAFRWGFALVFGWDHAPCGSCGRGSGSNHRGGFGPGTNDQSFGGGSSKDR